MPHRPDDAPHRSSNRIETIQWLRGIAAMLVVFNHAALLAIENDATFGGAWRGVVSGLALLGGIGVDIFFVISGFVMAMTATRFWGCSGAARFLLLRFNRIAPLYYLLSIVLLLDMIRAQVPFGFAEIANTLTFLPVFDLDTYAWPIHYLGWTLAFEFAFYLVVATMIAARASSRHGVLLAVVFALPVLGLLWQGRWVGWQFLSSPMFLEFGLGVLAHIAYRRGLFHRSSTTWTLLALAGAAVAIVPAWTVPWLIELVAERQFEQWGAFVRAVCWGIPSFLIVAGVLSCTPTGPRMGIAVLRALGDASYSIYLTHLFVVRVALEVLQRGQLDPTIVMLGVLVVSPLVGIAAYRFVERPLMHRGNRVIAWMIVRARPYKFRLRAALYGYAPRARRRG